MRHFDWDTLRVFLAIVRAGSLRGAAMTLGVNHATVARSLSALEEGLGTRVFDRSVRGLGLTQPGETLVADAEAMERRMQDVGRRLTGLDARPSGIVRVSLPPSFGHGFFAPILAAFGRAHPQIEVHVIATNRISDLTRQEADVSIRAAHQVDDDVVGRRLVDYVTGTFATPAYIAAHPEIAATRGAGAHWIGWGVGTGWVAKSPLPAAGVRHSLPEVFMQIEAAAAGIGMAFVPAFLADPHPGLIRVPGVPVALGRGLWILLHGDLRTTARVRAFVDFFAASIEERKTQFAL